MTLKTITMEAIKYIKYSLMSFAIAATITACNYLDKVPEDQLTLEMVFEDKIRTEDWLAGVYSGIPNPLWGYFREEGFNTMSDDMTIPSEWQPFGWRTAYKFTTGDWNPSINWLGAENYWDALPRRIRNGNIFLEKAHALPGQGLPAEEVENMKYEVRFLKAYYYSLMLEIYGPVPFAPDEIQTPSTPTTEMLSTQTPYDEIVNWIDKELLEVSKHLPAVYEDTNWGRATSVMALAVRAKTLLYAASPLFNGNPAFKNWKNGDGELLFSTYDAGKWKRAADAFEELITLAHSSGYELYKEYNDDGSIDPFMSYYNLSLKRFSEGNKEILFGRATTPDLNNFQSHHLPKGIGGNAGMGVTQELVDAFYMKDGTVPILGYKEGGQPIINPDAPLYSETGFSNADERRNTKWQGGGGNGKVTLSGTYKMYCNREPRFYVSVIFNEAWLGVEKRRVNFYMDKGKDTAHSFDAPQNGYNVRKRISLDVYPKDRKYTYQPGIIYRLADAYLGYAEALNESQPGHPDILKYINLVRERAGIPAVQGGSQDEIRELIRRERRVELNMEGARFNDLRRWLLADKYLSGRFYGMNFEGRDKSDDPNNSNAYYVRTYHRSRMFTPKMYLWPVPQDEMDKNPNLTQAPGYTNDL